MEGVRMKIKNKLFPSGTKPALALKTNERITQYPQIFSFSPRSFRKIAQTEH